MSSDYKFGPSWGADTQPDNDAQIKRVRDNMLNKGTTMPSAFDPGAVDSRGIPTVQALPPTPSARQVGGSHYKDMAIQPSEFIFKNNLNWLEGNIVKYTCRHAKKNGIQDLEKARHYLDLLIQWQYGQS